MSKIGKGLAILLGVTTIAAGGMAGGMYVGENNYRNKTIEMEAQDKTELEEMAEQLEAMSLILDEQEEEITSLRSTKTSLETDKANLQAEVSAKQTAITGLNATIAELEAQGEADSTTIATLTSQKTALETEVSEKQAAISSLNSQITTLEGTISDKQTQLDSLTSQLSTLQAAHTELQAQYSTLETSNGELDVQIALLQGQIASLQEQVNAINPDEVLMGKILNASLREELTMYTPTNLALPSKTFDDVSGIITLDEEVGTYYYDSTTKSFRRIFSDQSFVPTDYTDGVFYSFEDDGINPPHCDFVDTNSSTIVSSTINFKGLQVLTTLCVLRGGNYVAYGLDVHGNDVVEAFNNNSAYTSDFENINVQNCQIVHHNGVDYLYSVDEAQDGAHRFYNLNGTQIVAISKSSNTIVASVVDDVDTIFIYSQYGDPSDLTYYSPNMFAPAQVPEHDNLYVDYGNIILEKDGEYFDLQGNDIFAGATVLSNDPHTTTRHNIDGNVFYTVVDPTVERMWFSIGDGVIGLPMVWDEDVTYTYALPEVYDETEGEEVVVSSFAELQAYFVENATVLAYVNAHENELTAMLDEGINPVIVISRVRNNMVGEVLDPAYAIYSSYGFQTFVTPDVGHQEDEFDDDEEIEVPEFDLDEDHYYNVEITPQSVEGSEAQFFTILYSNGEDDGSGEIVVDNERLMLIGFETEFDNLGAVAIGKTGRGQNVNGVRYPIGLEVPSYSFISFIEVLDIEQLLQSLDTRDIALTPEGVGRESRTEILSGYEICGDFYADSYTRIRALVDYLDAFIEAHENDHHDDIADVIALRSSMGNRPFRNYVAEDWEDTGDLPFAYVTFSDIDDCHGTGACIIDFVNWKIYPAPLY